MIWKFSKYKSCKSNINLVILHIGSQGAYLVCWSWCQPWSSIGERSQVQHPVTCHFSIFFEINTISWLGWTDLWFYWYSRLNLGSRGSLRSLKCLVLAYKKSVYTITWHGWTNLWFYRFSRLNLGSHVSLRSLKCLVHAYKKSISWPFHG